MRGRAALAALCLAGLAACGPREAGEWHVWAQERLEEGGARARAEAEYGEARALELDSTLVEAAFSLAELQRARGAYEEAARLYRRLIEQEPEQGRAYAGLGLSLAAQGRYNGAVRAYQDALRRGEKTAAVYARLGHAYQALGHKEENLLAAAASYRAALQLGPEDGELLLQLGRVEARLGRGQEALALYQRALELRPEDEGLRVELAALYRGRGQAQVARGVLAEGLAREGGDRALLHLELGRLLREDGEGERALEQFEQALAADSTLDYAYRYAGLLHSERGRPARALELFRRLQELRPDDAAVRVSIGIVHTQAGNLAAAAAAFEEGLALGGDNGDAALKLGGLYAHQGRFREAVRAFEEGIAAAPENAELHASLGDVYRQLGMLSAALDAGRRAVRLQPQTPLWQFHLAASEERLDPEAGRAAWARYIELAEGRAEEAQRLEVARRHLRELEGE